jgi:hypothetical protein
VVPRFGQCHSGMGGVHRAASSPTEGRENDRPRRVCLSQDAPAELGGFQSADATNRYRFRLKK